jgi:hypothetical protein
VDITTKSNGMTAPGVSAKKIYKGVLTAICLLAFSATAVIADWKVIADFEDREAEKLTDWSVEQGDGAFEPIIEVVNPEGDGNGSQGCLELKFKSPGTWSKANYKFPLDVQIGEEYASKSIKFLLKGDGTEQAFNLRLMESTLCQAHPSHASLVYIPSIPLADDTWQEIVFELAPDVFVPHPDHSDGNDDLDWPIVGLVIGVSSATTTFYVDEIKVGEGEEEKAVSFSVKLAVAWGKIKTNAE